MSDDNIDEDYEILSDKGFYNFIYKFDATGKLEDYSVKTIDVDENIFLSYFDMIAYVADIRKSYPSKSAMLLQFEKDYNRQTIILNNKKYDIINFCKEIKKKLKEFDYNDNQIDQFKMSFESLILLLCCQSTFSLPYMILLNTYKIDNNINILSCGCNNEDFSKIMINIDENEIKLDLSAILYIKDIDTNTNEQKITLSITCQLSKNIKKYEPQFCIFSWIIKKLV
ncbi:hypothetical protein BMW23_0768 [Bodo saltans virus]|uniref:Uncharacterized protein n=1 Tax=Bodo saltans virus TaxID=2024608 RepID=A0A2H4UVC2_9VIRU|nr:hypothetical protein QJ851_gp0751 [Bodo saltans virus]ATZ80814.1 hypothetical protein BMW23_0768 [Bodo saltans virus]